MRGSTQARTHARTQRRAADVEREQQQQRTNQQLPHVGLVAQVAVDFLQPAADALKASFAGDVIDENNPVGPVEERFRCEDRFLNETRTSTTRAAPSGAPGPWRSLPPIVRRRDIPGVCVYVSAQMGGLE